MTDARPTSFPFLAIAKEFGISYRDVMLEVQDCDAVYHEIRMPLLPAGARLRIYAAIQAERDRRAGLPEAQTAVEVQPRLG